MLKDAVYIVEADLEGDDGSVKVLTFSQDELAGYLAKNIEYEHYSGCGDVIKSIYRYDGVGKITRMVLTFTGEDRDTGDWLYLHYGVWAPGAPEEVDLTFTVRIDGRA